MPFAAIILAAATVLPGRSNLQEPSGGLRPRLAREIEEAIHLPPTWRVVMTQDDPDPSEGAIHFPVQPGSEFLTATIADRSDRKLPVRMTPDHQWVLIGSAAFIGPDGATEFSRTQFRTRKDFFPLRAIPIVLESLESELDALPLGGSTVEYLSIESGRPSGDTPSVRCVLSIRDKAGRTEIRLNGVVPLPPSAAHGKDFTFSGSQGFGDSVIGPVTSTRPLGHVLREARAMVDAIHSGGEWRSHVFHNNGSVSFATLVTDARNRGQQERGPAIEIHTEGPSVSIAGVPVTSEGLGVFLGELQLAYDAKEEEVFLVMGCADHREILVLLTSAGAIPPVASDLRVLRFVFDAGGTKLGGMERIAVRDIQSATEALHVRWTYRFGDDRTADVWVHKPVICSMGLDLTPRARIGETDYRVAGGLVLSLLR